MEFYAESKNELAPQALEFGEDGDLIANIRMLDQTFITY